MACSYNLFTSLGGSPQTGGTWTAGPSNPNSFGFSTGSCGDGTCSFFDAGASGVTTGTYSFTYTVGSGACNDSATVTFTVVAAPASVPNFSLGLCTGDAPVTLMSLTGFTGITTGGAWLPTSSGLASAGYIPNGAGITDDQFNPTLSGPGVYAFTYSVTTPGTNAACTDCTSQTTLTITVTEDPDAGNSASYTVCT